MGRTHTVLHLGWGTAPLGARRGTSAIEREEPTCMYVRNLNLTHQQRTSRRPNIYDIRTYPKPNLLGAKIARSAERKWSKLYKACFPHSHLSSLEHTLAYLACLVGVSLFLRELWVPFEMVQPKVLKGVCSVQKKAWSLYLGGPYFWGVLALLFHCFPGCCEEMMKKKIGSIWLCGVLLAFFFFGRGGSCWLFF